MILTKNDESTNINSSVANTDPKLFMHIRKSLDEPSKKNIWMKENLYLKTESVMISDIEK